MELKSVYLDYNSTTPLAPDLKSWIASNLDAWGNASSIHWASRTPRAWLRETRQLLAENLKAQPLDFIFNSGGSEGNNTVIKAVANWAKKNGRNHFLHSSVEHPSVLKSFAYLREQGAEVESIPVSRQGALNLDFLRTKISEKTALVSVMLANNETGTLFPIKEIASIAHAKGALMHTDGVQALGKISISLLDLDVDYACFSAHKFYSLKGAGFVYVKKSAPYEPLIHGSQERQRRGGTENTLAIACMGESLKKLPLMAQANTRVAELRDLMEERILNEIPEVKITAKESPRLPNTSSLVVNNVGGETLLMSLDLKGIAVSTGSACSSGSSEPSSTLMAMGLTESEAQSSLRVSLGWQTTAEEINFFVNTLKEIVKHLRAIQIRSKEITHGI